MTDHCIIRADFSAARVVAGRKILALTFEVPIEEADTALARLGGFPQPGSSRWVAIALLQAEGGTKELGEPASGLDKNWVAGPFTPEETAIANKIGSPGSKKSWNELKRSQQAHLLIHSPDFWEYFNCKDAVEADGRLKRQLRIASKSDLDKIANHHNWDEFVALWRLHRERLK